MSGTGALRPWDIRGLRYGDTDTQQLLITENVSSPQGTPPLSSEVPEERRTEAMDSAGLVDGRCGSSGRLTAWMRAPRIEGSDEQMGREGTASIETQSHWQYPTRAPPRQSPPPPVEGCGQGRGDQCCLVREGSIPEARKRLEVF